jgi:uncharacterized RDD family membrane protein YckC
VLPEGVVLAPVGRRIGAWFLAIPLSIVTLFIGYIIWGLIVWRKGYTPALQVLGMRVIRLETGQPSTFWWMALRGLGYVVENIASGIIAIVSFVIMCTRPDRRCIHDFIGGAIVVHDPNKVLPQ